MGLLGGGGFWNSSVSSRGRFFTDEGPGTGAVAIGEKVETDAEEDAVAVEATATLVFETGAEDVAGVMVIGGAAEEAAEEDKEGEEGEDVVFRTAGEPSRPEIEASAPLPKAKGLGQLLGG